MIFDTHAHYDQKQFDEDRDQLLASMQAGGIGRIVNIGCDIKTSEKCIELAEKYDFIYAAAGVHPSDAVTSLDPAQDEENLAAVSRMADHEKVLAIGEIGLDYYWIKDPDQRARQKVWFRRQIDLAREKGLPIVIHSREAAKDTLDIGKEENIRDVGGVMHCFSYPREIAREYLDMGFFLGIGGVLTYKNSRVLKEVVAYAPAESLVLETDCPYLSPVPFRGKRNSSLNLPYVVEAFAQIKGMSREEVEEVTWNNALRLYRMKG